MLTKLMTLGLCALTVTALMAAERLSRGEVKSEDTVVPSGLRVVMDPETGEIVAQPTASQLGRVVRDSPFERKRTERDLRRFAIAAGGQGVALEGWGQHSLRVERGEDGSLRTVCSQGDEHRSGR